MKRIIFITLFLLLSHESSASLMQLHYQDFYAQVSPSNPPPVDKSGVVSLTIDSAVQDSDASQDTGIFANSITNGFMFLRGVQYDMDFNAPNSIKTVSSGLGSLTATGSIVNQALGSVSSFYLYLGGGLSANAGQTLADLVLSCFELHLIVFDPKVELYSAEYYATLQSFENGTVAVASVLEPSAFALLVLSLMGVVTVRVVKLRK